MEEARLPVEQVGASQGRGSAVCVPGAVSPFHRVSKPEHDDVMSSLSRRTLVSPLSDPMADDTNARSVSRSRSGRAGASKEGRQNKSGPGAEPAEVVALVEGMSGENREVL